MLNSAMDVFFGMLLTLVASTKTSQDFTNNPQRLNLTQLFTEASVSEVIRDEEGSTSAIHEYTYFEVLAPPVVYNRTYVGNNNFEQYEFQSLEIGIGAPVPDNRTLEAMISSNQSDETKNMSLVPEKDDRSTRTSGNKSVLNGSITILGLCAFPAFNNREQCLRLDYYTQPLIECEFEHGAALFGFFVVLLALVIIFSNCLLPIVVWKSSKMRTQYDYIKVSLAFADMVPGFVLLGTVIPNMIWTRKTSESDIVNYVTSHANSPRAIIEGSLITLSAQASLLHLTFLSVERFIAIKWAFWHMMRRTRTIMATLGIIWTVSLLCSFVPAAFPERFEYKYQPALFIHLMTLKKLPDGSYGVHGEIYGTFTMILPYVVMMIFCVATGVVVYRKMAARKTRFGLDKTRKRMDIEASKEVSLSPKKVSAGNYEKKAKKEGIKPEISVFITLITMIVVFTITLTPFTVVLFLFVGEILNCSNYTLPYVITFYEGMINCFANAVIYTFRDRRFRKAVKNVFCSVFSKYESKTATNSNSTHSERL